MSDLLALPGLRTPLPGLRAQQKRERRLRISDAATHLFVDRGFDAVTVAEVAVAAEVAEKTVFNYFATKEDLLFDRSEEILDELARLVRDRPPGTSPARALRVDALARWGPFDGTDLSRLEDPATGDLLARFHGAIAASEALLARERRDEADLAARFAAVLAAESGVDADDPVAVVPAGLLAAARALVVGDLRRRLLGGERGPGLVGGHRAMVDQLFAGVDAALRVLGPGSTAGASPEVVPGHPILRH